MSEARDVGVATATKPGEIYALPAASGHSAEHERLDIQHYMLKKRLNGLYPKPEIVQKILAARSDGSRPAVLDVGTGTGIWAREIATQFPHVDVLGIDLAPPVANASTPTNCRFEKHDVNDGIRHFGQKFDLIHARSMSLGCKDFHQTIKEFAEILHPGGLLILFDGDPRTYGSDRQAIIAENEGDAGFSWMAKYTRAGRAAMQARSLGIDAVFSYESWLKGMDEWAEYGREDFFIPIGPWEKEGDEATVLQRNNLLIVTRSLRPLLIANGHDEATVDTWIANVEDELKNLKAHMYFKWSGFHAVKKA